MANNDPLQGLLADLLKMVGGTAGGAGANAWLDAARGLAQSVATDGQPEPNPDPLSRIHLEELTRVAELHVADATGLPFDRTPTIEPVGRGAWAQRTLDAWAPTLADVVAAQRDASSQTPAAAGGSEDPFASSVPLTGDGLGALLGRFASTMGPVLLGMQFGSAAGHLAQHAFGQYALPLPWPSGDRVLVVPDNVDHFAEEWSLPPDETRLWICVQTLASHAVLSVPHVAERISALVGSITVEMVGTDQGLAERLGGEAGDPSAIQRILSDPESLLADLLTPGQRRTSQDLVAVTTAVAGYVDHVTALVASPLVRSAGTLAEAWYRYRTEEATSEQAAGALFGLDLGRAQVDRGQAFVRGVVERAGEEGLGRLWSDPRNLPTPAELNAPGLWLERIDLPED